MRRIPGLLAVLALLVPLLAACGGQTTSSVPGATAPSPAAEQPTAAANAPPAATQASGGATANGQKVKIRLTTWTGVDEAKELQAVIDKVNAQATTYEIVHEPQPADYDTKVQTNLAGGSAADLIWLSQEKITGYAQKGVLLDITDRLKSDKRPAANLDDYFAPILQTTQYEGKTYGLPWIAQPVMLYYNEKMFKDAGIAPPDETWTWDDFKAAAEKLTKDTDGDGKPDQFGTAFNGWPPIQMFIWQAGGEVVSEDRTQSPIDSPEAMAAEKFYADIIYNPKYAAPEEVIKEQGFGELAKNGRVAMFFGGAADDLSYAHEKDPKFVNMKMALVPKGPKDRTTFSWTAATVINAATKYPDQAYDALVDLSEGIDHWKIVAPRKSLANVETIAASVPLKRDGADVIIKALPDARAYRIVPRQSDWDTAFLEEFQDPLFHKQGTVEDLAKKVRPDLEAALTP